MRKPSYIDLINHFWLSGSEKPFTPEEVTLYFYLLQVCNRLHWPEQFKHYDSNIVEMTGLTREQIVRARKLLKRRPLIGYVLSHKHPLATYSLLDVYINWKEQNPHLFPLEVPQNSPAFKKTREKTIKENKKRKKNHLTNEELEILRFQPKRWTNRRNPDPDDERLYCGRVE